MQDISRVTTLKSIVDDVLNDLQHGESQFLRYLRFAERGLQFLQLYALDNVSVQTITVDGSKMFAPYPYDMAKLIRIGFFVNGEFKELAVNNNIPINRAVDCGVTVNESLDDNHIRYNNRVPFIGEIRMNDKMGRFEFGSDLPNMDLVIEYVGTGLNESSETLVPEIAREVLIAWIHWKRVENDDSVAQNLRIEKENSFKEKYIVFRQLKAPSLDQILQIWYKTKRKIL